MGEAGPEAVMPLTRDGNGRLGVSVNGAGGGEAQATVAQAVTINITVNEGEGGKSSQSKSSGDDTGAWKKMADRVKNVVREELATQQRPGGLLYK
jgi:phage-related minor tail protein